MEHTISVPWKDEGMETLDWSRVKVNGEIATKVFDERNHYRSALIRIENLNIEAHREAVNIACTALHCD